VCKGRMRVGNRFRVKARVRNRFRVKMRVGNRFRVKARVRNRFRVKMRVGNRFRVKARVRALFTYGAVRACRQLWELIPAELGKATYAGAGRG
jgi:hypothetical protein